jgi:hypothetical protein
VAAMVEAAKLRLLTDPNDIAVAAEWRLA